MGDYLLALLCRLLLPLIAAEVRILRDQLRQQVETLQQNRRDYLRREPDPILSALLAEVARAEELHGPLPIGAPSERLAAVLGGLEVIARLDLAASAPTAMAVLCEEVGELGRATTPEEQREEAIQVMAVCYRLVRALP